ncbi:Monothiol glutaredoxin-7 [Escovopsis weberi]|uniref:Monothiol glutaredoxin-7 n=1 Tax=Escovopsis weberi TaxID=150374 RepID=A0A0M8N0D8_ESCWE|nr:Monothiol glutaredoxin-7 [Escovopsis weberi]
MPSMRRIRLLAVATVVAVAVVLFYSTSLRGPSSSSSSSSSTSSTIGDFYHKTKGAIDRSKTRSQIVIDAQTGAQAGQIPADRDADGNVDDDDEHSGRRMMERLQASEQQAKKQANEKGGLKPDAPSLVVGVGSAAEGQKKAGAGDAPFPVKEKGKGKGKGRLKEGELKSKEEADDDNDDDDNGEDKSKGKSSEEREAEREMNAILKKSPVILFSKTYCPHSKRAKGLLLEKYAITPEPYVVELDEHPLGPALQDLLEAKTGRRTVPNVMVNGVSVGGADQLVQLDGDGELVAKISDLGQKRVEIMERFVARDPK